MPASALPSKARVGVGRAAVSVKLFVSLRAVCEFQLFVLAFVFPVVLLHLPIEYITLPSFVISVVCPML